MPTVIPDIFCLLLTGLPREQSRTHHLLLSHCPGRARDLRRMFGGLSSRIPPAGRPGDRRVKRLPVINDTGLLIGIVSRADVLRVFARPDADIRREANEEVIAETFLV